VTLVNALVVLGVLVLLESASRAMGVRMPSLPRAATGFTGRALWVYDRTKGWFHAPYSTGRSDLGGPDQGLVRINALGLRGGEVRPAKAPGTKRVLVLGDSFVFGVGVDEEHLFTSRLSELLTDSPGGPYEVVNMGVSGYSTDQEYLLFRELGRTLGPDLVLLVVTDNDFSGNAVGFAYARYYKPTFVLEDGRLDLRNVPVPELDAGQRVKLWLAQESNVWNFFRTRRSENAAVRRALGLFAIEVPVPTVRNPVPLTSAIVEALDDEVSRAGARLVVLNTGQAGEDTGLFESLCRRLDAKGVLHLSLTRVMGEARRTRPGEWEFPGDTHWNRSAHRLAAETAWEYLRETGLVRDAPAAIAGYAANRVDAPPRIGTASGGKPDAIGDGGPP
jgi:hypothetical protein